MLVRALDKFTVDDGCWEWQAGLTTSGYGQIFDGERPTRAYHAIYESLRGPVAEGLELDHLCRNRRCVRPSHLEPVTKRENILRGDSPMAHQARQTHCKNGHAFTPENTHVTSRGKRDCRTCNREYVKQWRRDHPDRAHALDAARYQRRKAASA